MNMFASLTTDTTIADEKDSVGSSYSILESDLYTGNITLAYTKKADSGALSLNLVIKTTTGSEITQTLWMTSGTAKGGKNYYEKDGVKNYLPGFLLANSICLLAVGKEISQLDAEEKVVQLYNSEAKAKVPTKVPMVMDLVGKDISFGLIKQTVDKNVKNDAGVYVPSGDTREENEIDKFFRASDMMTTAEIRAQATEATFAAIWKAKWNGQVRNKAKGAGANGTAGAPKAFGAATAKKPATSLFA